MSHRTIRDTWIRLRRLRATGYAVALTSTALSALMRWALPAALTPAPYLGFYPAVVVSAALGGTGPGLVSTFASLLLVNFVFGRFDVHNSGAVTRQLIWIIASIGVSLLAGMQRAARLQRDRLAAQRQLALDAARMGWWHHDPATRMNRFDGRYAEILGLAGHQAPLTEVLQRVHPADLERARETHEAARASVHHSPFSIEHRIVRPDGAVRWVEAHALATSDDRGSVSLLGTVSDITDRKEAEEALRRHELVVLQSRDIILFMRHDDGRILEANPAAAAAYGYSREELLGLSIFDLRAPGTAALVEAHMAEALVRGVLFESIHRRRDGTTFPVEVSSRGVTVEGTGTLISVVRDITERKRAEAALQKANEALRGADRRKDEFLGMLSHELRNPLAPIRSSTYILRRAAPGAEQARRALDVIDRQTDHLSRLVDDLLDVTRISRGKIELRRARVDLRELVLQAADDRRQLLEDRGIALRASAPDGPIWTDVDETRIAQILGNMLHNAAKFTSRGGKVELSVAVVRGAAEVRVVDTGVGIEPELIPHVFEPFVQEDRTLDRTQGGLGLGLALVKGIVDLHGGEVSAESDGKGKGASFRVRLPLVKADVSDSCELRPALVARAQRILVVDDNRDAAQTMADVAGLLGHSAAIVYDGPSAVKRALAERFDIVLCDIGLPRMSGYEVAKALRAAGFEGMRLFAVSGYAQPEDVRRSVEAGFDGHIAKPCSPAHLAHLLA